MIAKNDEIKFSFSSKYSLYWEYKSVAKLADWNWLSMMNNFTNSWESLTMDLLICPESEISLNSQCFQWLYRFKLCKYDFSIYSGKYHKSYKSIHLVFNSINKDIKSQFTFNGNENIHSKIHLSSRCINNLLEVKVHKFKLLNIERSMKRWNIPVQQHY